MTDLTSERLDELEMTLIEWQLRHDPAPIPHNDVFALIAMAKRTHQAERERDEMRAAVNDLNEYGAMVYRAYQGDAHWHCVACEERVDMRPHKLDCPWAILRALAEPTGAGGDA